VTKKELELLKSDLAFSVFAINLLKKGEHRAIDDGMWVKIFDTPSVPDSYRNDLFMASTELIEKSIPEVGVIYEIRLLEYQRQLAEARIAELRGLLNGEQMA